MFIYIRDRVKYFFLGNGMNQNRWFGRYELISFQKYVKNLKLSS